MKTIQNTPNINKQINNSSGKPLPSSNSSNRLKSSPLISIILRIITRSTKYMKINHNTDIVDRIVKIVSI